MPALKGDFLGFTYNGVHSSELGITRVNDGDRHTQIELPSVQDKTVQIPGADGTYFFNSYYTNRQIQVPFAFDGVTDAQLHKMRKLFGDKKIHDLVLDEEPYKAYRVKISGPYNVKEVCFLEKGNRVYKGEGTINFVGYDPYAHGRWHFLDEVVTFRSIVSYVFQNVLTLEYTRGLDLRRPLYIEDYGQVQVDYHFNVHLTTVGEGDALYHNHILDGTNRNVALQGSITRFGDELIGKRVWQTADNAGDNFNEWAPASGLIKNPFVTQPDGTYEEEYTLAKSAKLVNSKHTFNFKVWNGGDVECPFTMQFGFTGAKQLKTCSFDILNKDTNAHFKITNVPAANENKGGVICIDSATRLVYDRTNGTDTLLNGYIESGDFFSLPCGASSWTVTVTPTATNEAQVCNLSLIYDYLYY